MSTLAEALADVFPDVRLRLHACVRKKAYPSQDAARQAQVRRQRLSGLPIGIYRCPWATHYHLTSHAAEPTPEDVQAQIQELVAQFEGRARQMAQLEARVRLRHVCKISYGDEGQP